MATFPAAAAAVAAAAAIQQAVAAHCRRRPDQTFAVRVGVSVGDITSEGSDCHGIPVVEAARLCAAADAGQILVADLVRALTRGRGGHCFLPLPALVLKGLSEPLAACSVEWEPLDAPVPLPAALSGAAELAFAGRAAEIDDLLAVWRDVAGGARRLVLVAGEPGIGKTRLAAELARRVHAEGATVLAGHCDDELGVPFQPFTEAIQHLAVHTPAPELRERLGRHGGDLVRLVPELARLTELPPVLQSDAETERYRLFEAVASCLASVAIERPLLVVLDDLHWATKPTLLLLRHVVRASDITRLLIVGTYRDTDLGRTHPLGDVLADLRRDAAVERIVLRGLDLPEVEALLAAAAGNPLDEPARALAGAIHAESEGNPFFVGEILRHLRESGELVERDGRWTTAGTADQLGIPEGVKQVIGRRLSRLSEDANVALAAAAVMGRDFGSSVLTRVVDLSEDRVLDVLAEAVTARLVEEIGVQRYRFAHALVRSTVYEELGVTRRVRLHRRIAEAFEAAHLACVDAVLAELAFHYGQSAAGGDVVKAIEYAIRAAEQAAAALAHDQAAAYYAQALELADDGDVRRDLQIRLGEAQRDAGNPTHRETLLQAAAEARSRGDTDRLARAALANTRGYASAYVEVDHDRVAMLEAALQALPETDSPRRARLAATLGVELTYSPNHERPAALLREAIAMARRLGDPATLAWVLGARFAGQITPDRQAERWVESAEHVALTAQLADPRERSLALTSRFSAALEAGDVGEADRQLEALAELTEETSLPAMRWSLRRRQSVRALLAGRIDDAEHFATEAFEIGRAAGQRDAALIYSGQISAVRMVQGRVAEIEPFLARATAMAPDHGLTRAIVASLYCELGQLAPAAALLERDAANRFADIPYAVGWLSAMTSYARVAAETQSTRVAVHLYECLVPWHEQVDAPGNTVNGSVALYLGLLAAVLGRHADAGAHFAEAEAMHERLAAPYWLAVTRVDWARSLLARDGPGDRDRARALLTQGHGAAVAHGFGGVERRASALLALEPRPPR